MSTNAVVYQALHPEDIVRRGGGLGIAFEIVGLLALFTTPLFTLIVLSLQALWVLAAGITLLVLAEKV